MADRDKDGIPDNIDIDGGSGTGKSGSKTPNQDASDEALLASIAPFLASLLAQDTGAKKAGPTDTSQSSTQTSVTKLNYNSAKALLEAAMKDADFVGKLTPDDIKAFMDAFEVEQNKQIEKIITSARTQIKPGATEAAQKKIIETVAREEFPSFFKPTDFAKNFIYAKIDFKDPSTLGAKSLDAFAKVRGLVDAFQLIGVSENEMRIAAKEIAMGNKSIEDYNVELQQIASKEYPQFADRFAKDPTLTTYDIAAPIINMLAKTWQMDPKSVKMDNPYVMSYLNYAGPDGKGKQPSYYDLLLKAKNDPKYDLTQEANENARDAAVGLSRAFGFGV
jgi:hypothetical protein